MNVSGIVHAPKWKSPYHHIHFSNLHSPTALITVEGSLHRAENQDPRGFTYYQAISHIYRRGGYSIHGPIHITNSSPTAYQHTQVETLPYGSSVRLTQADHHHHPIFYGTNSLQQAIASVENLTFCKEVVSLP